MIARIIEGQGLQLNIADDASSSWRTHDASMTHVCQMYDVMTCTWRMHLQVSSIFFSAEENGDILMYSATISDNVHLPWPWASADNAGFDFN